MSIDTWLTWCLLSVRTGWRVGTFPGVPRGRSVRIPYERKIYGIPMEVLPPTASHFKSAVFIGLTRLGDSPEDNRMIGGSTQLTLCPTHFAVEFTGESFEFQDDVGYR